MFAALLSLCFLLQDAPAPAAPGPTPQAPEICKTADQLFAAGKKDQARGEYLSAIWHDPHYVGALRGLVATAENDEQRAFWTLALADAAADERGDAKLDAAAKKMLGNISLSRNVPAARADAMRELTSFVNKLKAGDSPALLRFASTLGFDIWGAPSVVDKKFAKEVEAASQRLAGKPDTILKALQTTMEAVFAKNQFGDALVGARILEGFVSQSGQKDLASTTPLPEMKAAREAAQRMTEKARDKMRETESAPLTLEAIQKMTPEEKRTHNQTHNSWANPAIGISPTQLYRVETINGLGTLEACLDQIEHHHRRLVNWFGKDPLKGRQGTVRIVPQGADLEREGAPYWWAQGFQTGDLTVVHFDHGTISGLGRTLAHELTHRFDQASYRGMPGWLAEGRAVWTGGAYGARNSENFVENYANKASISRAHYKEYGKEEKLQKLIEGNLDDYRDNYTAGHALWVYLSSYKKNDKFIYADRIPSYLEGLKTMGSSLEWFHTCFIDGAEGRPNTFPHFATRFGKFIKAFYWSSLEEWTKSYLGEIPHKEAVEFVYDGPNWHGSRERAEPYFAQDHAAEAGKWLASMGNSAGAIQALELAFEVDELNLENGRVLAELYEKNFKTNAAWAVRYLMNRAWPKKEPSPGAAPGILHSLLNRSEDLANAQKKAYAEAKNTNVSRCSVGYSCAISGFVYDRLRDYEDFPYPDQWAYLPSGVLVLGRDQAGLQSGGLERSASAIQTFVRNQEWMQGSYSVSARIRPLTSYSNGAVVLGYHRRDRQFRVSFSFGDFDYATGKRDQERGVREVTISTSDLRAREPELSGTESSATISLPQGSTNFLLEVLVNRQWAHVFVNGERVASYATTSGLDIDGYVGFASGAGAVEIDHPTLQRHQARAQESTCSCKRWPKELDLLENSNEPWLRQSQLPVKDVPPSALGTAAVWFPPLSLHSDPNHEKIAMSMTEMATEFLKQRTEEGFQDLPLLILIPDDWTPEMEKILHDAADSLMKPQDKILKHKENEGYAATVRKQGSAKLPFLRTWFLYIDPQGVLRTKEGAEKARGIPEKMMHWLRVSRGW